MNIRQCVQDLSFVEATDTCLDSYAPCYRCQGFDFWHAAKESREETAFGAMPDPPVVQSRREWAQPLWRICATGSADFWGRPRVSLLLRSFSAARKQLCISLDWECVDVQMLTFIHCSRVYCHFSLISNRVLCFALNFLALLEAFPLDCLSLLVCCLLFCLG